jgi:hypothetical protein
MAVLFLHLLTTVARVGGEFQFVPHSRLNKRAFAVIHAGPNSHARQI